MPTTHGLIKCDKVDKSNKISNRLNNNVFHIVSSLMKEPINRKYIWKVSTTKFFVGFNYISSISKNSLNTQHF